MLNLIPDDDPDDAAFDALCGRIRAACCGADLGTGMAALVCELSEALGRCPAAARQQELELVIANIRQYVSEIPPC